MRERCFGCGKFFKKGTGKAIKVTRSDNGFVQFFCESCVVERLEFIRREKGPDATFKAYIGENKKVEFI